MIYLISPISCSFGTVCNMTKQNDFEFTQGLRTKEMPNKEIEMHPLCSCMFLVHLFPSLCVWVWLLSPAASPAQLTILESRADYHLLINYMQYIYPTQLSSLCQIVSLSGNSCYLPQLNDSEPKLGAHWLFVSV